MNFNFMDFIDLLRSEWSYHLSNILILIVFSLYGAYKTIKKRTELEIFKETEKKKNKLTDREKNTIQKEQKKGLFKELFKAFLGLFSVYAIYIVYRSGIFL